MKVEEICSINTQVADVISAQDYMPFGMHMPGRTFTSNSYKYGFNGKENSGSGNQYDYGFRIYNPRIAKFLSVDPLFRAYPWNSSYAFAENDVIRSIDLDGLEKKVVTLVWSEPHLDGSRSVIASYATVMHKTPIPHGNGQFKAETSVLNIDANFKQISFYNIVEPVDQDGFNSNGLRPAAYYNYLDPDDALTRSKELFDHMFDSPFDPLGNLEDGIARDMFAPETKKEMEPFNQMADLSVTILFGPAKAAIWPWKTGKLAAKEIRYASCDDCAKAIQEAVGGDILKVSNPRGLKLGPVKVGDETVNEWYYHKAVLKDNMVYDRITGPDGMHIDDYKGLFEYADDLTFEIIK